MVDVLDDELQDEICENPPVKDSTSTPKKREKKAAKKIKPEKDNALADEAKTEEKRR